MEWPFGQMAGEVGHGTVVSSKFGINPVFVPLGISLPFDLEVTKLLTVIITT